MHLLPQRVFKRPILLITHVEKTPCCFESELNMKLKEKSGIEADICVSNP